MKLLKAPLRGVNQEIRTFEKGMKMFPVMTNIFSRLTKTRKEALCPVSSCLPLQECTTKSW